jgi:hypothetical protein
LPKQRDVDWSDRTVIGQVRSRRFRELLSHLRDRGLRRTAQVGLSAWRDRQFDHLGGFDTRKCEQLHDRKGRIPALENATIYAPTRARPLSSLLRALNVPRDAVFVDFGCGKGRALIVAAQYGVRRLKGIELVPEFIRTCETNLRKLRSQAGHFEWQIFNTDIKDYAVSPEDDVFYLYDPCAWPGVVTCLENILASWRQYPRLVRVIYHDNLLARSRLEADLSGFDHLAEHCFDGNRFYVATKAA